MRKTGARYEVRGAGWVAAAAFVLGACHEIPQDAVKPYAGKEDTKAYAGDRFKGDQAAYEKALGQRAQTQNEYVRTGDAKTK